MNKKEINSTSNFFTFVTSHIPLLDNLKLKNVIVKIQLLMMSSLLFVSGIMIGNKMNAEEVLNNTYPNANLYELPDNNCYDFEKEETIESFVYGKSSLGKFSISGNITDIEKYRGKTAYGVSGILSFSYSYDGSLHDKDVESWNISTDTATIVAGCNLTGSIGQGVVLIQTSDDGSIYENVVNPVTDFFKDKVGRNSFYTTSGEDIAKGKFYRIIVAYETMRKTGTSGFIFKKDVYEYKNNAEVYEFYACRNDAEISIHNLSVDEESLKIDGYTLDSIKHGETLTDGAVTTKGFSIDTLGSAYLVSVSKNDEPEQYVESGKSFYEDGKYKITTITKLGKKKTKTIYIFSGGEDKGFSTYFDEYIVHGNRIYRDRQFPVYAKNSVAYLKTTSANVPFITGLLKNETTGEQFSFENDSHKEQSILLTPGEYTGTFYSGNPDVSAGSYYRYSFQFEILDENSSPYVNYNNLMNTQNLEDLNAKHYEVAYQMTQGGYIFVCFSLDSYKEAREYAYEIEKRFIEKAEDGGLYYKSENNPNNKVKYYDKVDLTRVCYLYAEQNVEFNYFNALDKYTYRTLDNIDELEKLNLPESVKVFPSNEEKEKMISRKPFINNFTFIKVADFDVISVEAYCYKNNKSYKLDFNKPVSEQLTVSSKYQIKETNIYGDTKTYDVYLMLDNLTKTEWNVKYDGVSSVLSLSADDFASGEKIITVDTISVKSTSNSLDDCSIVTIKAPNVYSYEIKCLLSELKNIELYKEGKYEISFIDRLGNSYKFIVNVTGKTRYSSLSENNECYTNFYNKIYMNKKALDEENIVNVEDLKKLMEINIEESKYTVNSYYVYKTRFLEAENVYNNPNATQEEINDAMKNLQKSIDNLVLSVDRTMLKAELNLYESIDKSKYTADSFNEYTKIYKNAVIIYENDSSSEDEVSSIVAELKKAYDNLILRGDKNILKEILSTAKAIDCSKYTPESIEELNNTFSFAYDVYTNDNATQSMIDMSIELIDLKINSLVLQADFTSLEDLIMKVKKVEPSRYTQTTIDNLKGKYDEACRVLNDKNSTQTEINVIFEKLKSAYDGLIESGDVKNLRILLCEIKEIKWFLYDANNLKLLKNQYDLSVMLLNNDMTSKEEISSTITLLNKLKEQLSQRDDKVNLYEYLLHCENVDLSNKSGKTVKKFKNAYDNAYNILLDLDASNEDVLSSIAELQATENDLKNSKLAWWVIALIAVGGIIVLLIIVAILKEFFFY